MYVAVFSNARTTVMAQNDGYKDAFNTAFRAGAVMGFALTGLGILVMYGTMCGFSTFYTQDDWMLMFDCLSGYGLGGSSIAMFGRVGGGIYTKAADVGADLVGKVIEDLPEDDPRNPATIADNVGDNVGDVAGMGADLFGSFAESTCAALVIASQTADLRNAGWGAICFPIVISCAGIVVCLICSFVVTHISPVTTEEKIESGLRMQLILTTLVMVPATVIIGNTYLPESFRIDGVSKSMTGTRTGAELCVIAGCVGGLIIGLVTEYYTSASYGPVREVAEKCGSGAATNIIYGLALGYKSVIIPIIILATIIYIAFESCDLYGVALAAVGMLGTLATGLTIDAYGPVCDNAGGVAEMAQLHESIRTKTDALDAAGNTTAAVGKGFAIGSAALVSLALYGAFVIRIRDASDGEYDNVEILTPLVFAFLLIGSMLPYWFSAMTMKSVGDAADAMVKEVKRQFDANPNLRNKHTTDRPDYDACIQISTDASLKEMIAPGALVMLSPLVVGTVFGVFAVYGLLTGALLSGIQMAISMSNTGGAWDNAKKYISAENVPEFGKKGTQTWLDAHKASVIGDTVGDPLKDTSGPALNILMKLMAIVSLVFADYFYAINEGQGILGLAVNR
jgi:inorganic pyrophosphatase